MDLKDLSTAHLTAIASAISATLLGLGRVVYLRLMRRDEFEQKRLTDQQDHSQELELSDRDELLKALKSQIKALDNRVKSLEGLLERYQTERIDHLTTIARLELRCQVLERENKDLRREVGLGERSEPS